MGIFDLFKRKQINSREIAIKKGKSLHIGQPKVYPTKIVEDLKEFFSRDPRVKAAYLGWIFDFTSGEPPHYIFALQGEGELKEIIAQAGMIAKENLEPHEFVDFIKITKSVGIEGYFVNETVPFYKRSD